MTFNIREENIVKTKGKLRYKEHMKNEYK